MKKQKKSKKSAYQPSMLPAHVLPGIPEKNRSAYRPGKLPAWVFDK